MTHPLQLEEMVDRIGMKAVVAALSQIAAEKAEHVETNWQDRKLAVAWNRNAGILDIAANKLMPVGSDR